MRFYFSLQKRVVWNSTMFVLLYLFCTSLISKTWMYTHLLQCCTLSFCCVSAHCCTEGRRVGNFSTCAEINFGRPPLSLSLSVCLEREDDKSFNWTFPFVCGGTSSVQQKIKFLQWLHSWGDFFYCSAIAWDLYTDAWLVLLIGFGVLALLMVFKTPEVLAEAAVSPRTFLWKLWIIRLWNIKDKSCSLRPCKSISHYENMIKARSGFLIWWI